MYVCCNYSTTTESLRFPQIVDSLSAPVDLNKPNELTYYALKLRPLGLPLSSYIHAFKFQNDEDYIAIFKRVGVEVFRAVKAAHSVDILHNDIRRPNILLVPEDVSLVYPES